MAKAEIDRRAKRILFDTFWTPSGWRKNSQTTPEDFAYAKSKGLMFDVLTMSHDEVTTWALNVRDAINPAVVLGAFVASLSSRRLDLRSGLGSYAVIRHLKKHAYEERAGDPRCRTCGICGHRSEIDLNILNFERFKWGGVRHDQPQYAAFDLEQLSRAEFDAPTLADLDILEKIIDTACTMPTSARLGDLSKAIAPLLSSNDQERRVLIGILGYCGILIDPQKPDFRTSFTSSEHRENTRHAKDDWPYPVRWWSGRFGVNEDAVADWFPEIGNR